MASVIAFPAASLEAPMTATEPVAPVIADAAPPAASTEPAPRAAPAWLRASGPNPRARAFAQRAVAVLAGLLVLVLLWSALAANTRLPGPGATWTSAVELFSDPFYRNSPNDQGIGWNVLASLKRVGLGFGAAALVGIPIGFAIGRFRFLGAAAGPVISLLRPVSPLAWLPIGLLLFKSAEPSAIFAIFICSIWPMIINTASGVQQVPREYLDVARVLRLSEWTVFRRILLPSSLPQVLTGVRLSVGVAWLVIVAAEMLTGGVGIGFWVWDEWNNLNVEHILIAIFVIGAVGLLLEQALLLIARRLP